jgi:hypothetical protein
MAVRMQAIEFTTTKIDEIEALVRARRGRVGPSLIHGTVTARRDSPGTYLTIVETAGEPSSEAAGSPVVADLMAELAQLCDTPPQVYDLALGSVPAPRAPLEPAGRVYAPEWIS